MRFVRRHLHRILLVVVILAVGGCELLGFNPDGDGSSPRAVRVVNETNQRLYLLAFTQDALSRISLVYEFEIEPEHPYVLSPGETRDVDFGEGFGPGDEAVFIPYAPVEEGKYRLAAMINRSYEHLRRRSFRFGIRPDDLNQIELEIHLTNSYEDDRVRVRLDGREVFDGRVTTDYTVSLAEVIHLKESAGPSEIEVLVNNTHSASTTIDLDEPLFVQVQFYRDDLPHFRIVEGIFFTVLRERPLYD